MKIAHLILCLSLMAGCKKSSVDDLYVKIEATPSTIDANGESKATITVEINNKASSDRRTFIFTTEKGTFSNGSKTITVNADFENTKLVANATLVAPMTEVASFKVKIKPEYDAYWGEFDTSVVLTAKKSEANSISLDVSSSGLNSSFQNEVWISGTVMNGPTKASEGYIVKFQDYLLNGSTANGQFRRVQDKTSDSSKVSAFYSASTYSIGTKIRIVATVENPPPGKVLGDTVVININK